jgi:hypothetical protein
VDQVIAPPIEGHVVDGWNDPHPVPFARQSSALSTTLGLTYPEPAALLEAGVPMPTWDGERPAWIAVQASVVMKSTEPWL